MKTRLIISFLLSASTMSGAVFAEKAVAQISTNLDALPPAPATTSPKNTTSAETRKPHLSQHTSKATSEKNSSVTQTMNAAHKAQENTPSPPGYTTIPAVPVTAPHNIVIAPPFVPVKKHPPVPPEEVKADNTAKSKFITLESDEKRILFDAQSAKINQATLDAMVELAKSLVAQPTKRIRMESYATGLDDDASTPRRVSLERVIILRSILMLNNVASTRIYPIAKGKADPSDKDPPDRVDIHIQENPVKMPQTLGLITSPSPSTTTEKRKDTP